jgi:hypothetical protein
VLTTRGHYPIIFHTTFFHQTFRDYCGIKLLLGHQYGSHYLHLNLENVTFMDYFSAIIVCKFDINYECE